MPTRCQCPLPNLPDDQKLFPDTALGGITLVKNRRPAPAGCQAGSSAGSPGLCSLLVGDCLCAVGSLERRLAGWRWTPVPASAAHTGQFALFLRSGLPFSITCPDFSKYTSLRVGLYAVKIRAEAMQEASEAVPSGMLSVLGQRQSKFAVACLEAQEHCKTRGIENPVCEVSNYLFPDCRVISGHLEVGVGGSSLPRARSGAKGGITAYPAARRAYWALCSALVLGSI